MDFFFLSLILTLEGTVDEEPSSVTGRKDSLSINLEFVKVSLSRMRRSGGPTFIESFVPTKGGKIDTTLINISGESQSGGGADSRAGSLSTSSFFLWSGFDTALHFFFCVCEILAFLRMTFNLSSAMIECSFYTLTAEAEKKKQYLFQSEGARIQKCFEI